MFQGSEHVADEEHFRLLQEIGANINGFTTEDGTTYYEVVPSNQLELGLYLESDRMGFLLPAMTQEKLDNQRDVVKNERRQRVDNVPYGTSNERIIKALYPPTHPYSWPVIGYMPDLTAASYDDVVDFFKKYYSPSNASLVVAGDIDPAAARRASISIAWGGTSGEGTVTDSGPDGVNMKGLLEAPEDLTSIYQSINYQSID